MKMKSGKIVPSSEAIRWVEKEHATESAADKYRLAQAKTLLESTITKSKPAAKSKK